MEFTGYAKFALPRFQIVGAFILALLCNTNCKEFIPQVSQNSTHTCGDERQREEIQTGRNGNP